MAMNPAYSPASVDLGLGAQLKEQLDTEEEQKRKKMLRQAQQMQASSLSSMMPLSAAATLGLNG